MVAFGTNTVVASTAEFQNPGLNIGKRSFFETKREMPQTAGGCVAWAGGVLLFGSVRFVTKDKL